MCKCYYVNKNDTYKYCWTLSSVVFLLQVAEMKRKYRVWEIIFPPLKMEKKLSCIHLL